MLPGPAVCRIRMDKFPSGLGSEHSSIDVFSRAPTLLCYNSGIVAVLQMVANTDAHRS